ncbi:hypothetical protein D3C86_2259680 [compost metagenome]
MKRGLRPKCCVSPIAVSGAVEKLAIDNPSKSRWLSPDPLASAASARPIHQAVLSMENLM